MAGATRTLSVDELDQRLTDGLDDLDEDVIATSAGLLPARRYLPMLLSVEPRLVRPHDQEDYFAHEQVDTCGVDGFTGLPVHPRTAYYRTFETGIDADNHLFEFVVPMVPPTWNDEDRVARYREVLGDSAMPTAVSVSVLDVCQPAVRSPRDHYGHWGLTHFLLDGHHKIQAAAETGRPLRLLSLLAVDDGVAGQPDVDRLTRVRAGSPGRRRPPG